MKKQNQPNEPNHKDIMEAVKHIAYNPNTGEIKRINRKNSNGSVDYYGYLIIKIKGAQWKAHRLAWVKHYGHPPKYNIDHIDGNKLNNKINNLRDVPQVINIQSTKRKPNKETGYVGIYKDKSTKGLIAKYTIRYNKKTYRFRNLENAVSFRKERRLAI